METVHIALPSDQNYVIGLTATAGSIAYYADNNVKLMMHILDGGIHEDTFDDFAKKINRLHPDVEFNRIKVDEALFEKFPAWSGNRMTYARLMLSEALPDVDHIIYCDTDFLWMIDIAQLWALRSDDVPLASVRDFGDTIAKEQAWAKAHDIDFDPEKYFCAGLSFYNLNLFRKERIIEQVAGFLAKYPDVEFADQTAMYHLLKDRVQLLPEKWQTLSLNLTPEKVRQPLAIHYAGDIPWTKGKFWAQSLSDASLVWFTMLSIINGESLRATLKSRLSSYQIFYKRHVAKIYKSRIKASIFEWILDTTGRGSYKVQFNHFSKDLKLNSKSIRKLFIQVNKNV